MVTMSILSIDLNVKGYIVWQDLSGRSLFDELLCNTKAISNISFNIEFDQS